MLIDKYLKTYEFSEYHEIAVSQLPAVVFPLIKTINFKKSKTIKMLFLMRGLPRKMETLDGFIECGFIELEKRENEELVAGFLLGIRGIKAISPLEFMRFAEANYIKGVWNFKLRQRGNETLLSTETRVHCPGNTARFFFSCYWFLIAYFSGLTRREMLRLIKAEAEAITGGE